MTEIQLSADSRKVVLAALAGNVAIAACKFGAAYLSHSTATLAEAVHSLADTGNQALLLVGMRLALRPRTSASPSVARASATSGRSSWRSCSSAWAARSPSSTGSTTSVIPCVEAHARAWSYGVLGVSLVMEGMSFRVALARVPQARRGPRRCVALCSRRATRPSRWCWPRTRRPSSGSLLALARGRRQRAHAARTSGTRWAASSSACCCAPWRWSSRGSPTACSSARAPRRRTARACSQLARGVDGVEAVTQLLTLHLGPDVVAPGAEGRVSSDADGRARWRT